MQCYCSYHHFTLCECQNECFCNRNCEVRGLDLNLSLILLPHICYLDSAQIQFQLPNCGILTPSMVPGLWLPGSLVAPRILMGATKSHTPDCVPGMSSHSPLLSFVPSWLWFWPACLVLLRILSSTSHLILLPLCPTQPSLSVFQFPLSSLLSWPSWS
jgi:hypothetical protein